MLYMDALEIDELNRHVKFLLQKTEDIKGVMEKYSKYDEDQYKRICKKLDKIAHHTNDLQDMFVIAWFHNHLKKHEEN